MSENRKMYLDKFDIMARYNVGPDSAMGIIRSIRFFNGGGALPRGKILPRELENWESRDEFNRRVYTPYTERIPARLVSFSNSKSEDREDIERERRAFAYACAEDGGVQ